MIRKFALISAGLLFVAMVGFDAGSPRAWAAAKKVDCGKVMSELKTGKKGTEVAKDLGYSPSSVYRCKKKDAAAKTDGKTGTTSASAATPAVSPAAKH
jgi:hypothetical protein